MSWDLEFTREGREAERKTFCSTPLRDAARGDRSLNFLIADTFTEALAHLPTADQKAAKTFAFDLQDQPAAPRYRNAPHRPVARSKLLVGAGQRRSAHHRAQTSRACCLPTSIVTTKRMPGRSGGGSRRIRRPGRSRSSRSASASRSCPCSPPAPRKRRRLRRARRRRPAGDRRPRRLARRRAVRDRGHVSRSRAPAAGGGCRGSPAICDHGRARKPAPAETPTDPYTHPDAQRRIRVIENHAELAQAVDAPWDRWMVYLHPSQRDVVEREFPGPARVAGSAGTGKTVVALHRAARLVRSSPDARVLLVTFSEPLAAALQAKVRLLMGPDPGVAPRVRVASLPGVGAELFELAFGRRPHIVKDDQVARSLERAVQASGQALRPEFPRLRMGERRRRVAGPGRGRVPRGAPARAQQARRLEAARAAVADLRRRPRRPFGERVRDVVQRVRRVDAALRGASGQALHPCRRR